MQHLHLNKELLNYEIANITKWYSLIHNYYSKKVKKMSTDWLLKLTNLIAAGRLH